MSFKNLKERLSKAYQNGNTKSSLSISLMMLDSAFLVPIPGSTTQEREDYVRGIIEPIQAHMKQIDEERRKYGFLERLAYNRGYRS